MNSSEYKTTPTVRDVNLNSTQKRRPLSPLPSSTVKTGNKGGRKRGGCAVNKYLTSQRKLKQQNLHGEIIKEIDCESFGNIIPKNTSPSLTRVAFHNVGPQPEKKFDSKSRQGAVSFSRGKYDILFFAEHGLNHSKILQSQNGTKE